MIRTDYNSAKSAPGKISAWAVGTGTFLIYILTCCKTVYVGDAGELIVAMSTGGIAHPPGYPLYTILGYLWLKLLAFVRPALAANLFSAATASVAALLLFRLLHRLNNQLPSAIKAGLAFAFALSFPVWSSATATEVYALSGLLYIAALYCLVGYHRTGSARQLILTGLCCGLILTHHFSAAVIGAGLLIAVILRREIPKASVIIATLIAMITPLTLYLYFLFRFDPALPVNWMSDGSLAALWKLVSGENYRQFVGWPGLSDFLLFGKKMAMKWLNDFGPGLAVLALPGLLIGLTRHRPLTFIILLPAVLNLIMVSCYRIPDFDGYLMPSLAATIIFIAFFFEAVWKRFKIRQSIVGLIVVVIVALPLSYNYSRCDISRFYLAERYGRDLLDSTPDNMILLLKSDNGSHTALYLHYLENYRPDIELYSSYSTLTRFLQKYTISAFMGSGWIGQPGDQVCRGIEYLIDPNVTLSSGLTKQQGLVLANIYTVPDSTGRAGFSGYSVDSTIEQRIEQFAQDSLLLIKLPDDYKAGQVALEYLLFLLNPYRNSENIRDAKSAILELRRLGATMGDPQTALAVARYFHARGRINQTKDWIDLAESFDPPSYSRKDILVNRARLFRREGKLSAAMQVLEEALSIDPEFVTARYNLKLTEANKAAQEQDWGQAVAAYESMFQLDNQDPLPLYNAAVILERIPGEKVRALEYYKEFVSLAGGKQSLTVGNARQRIEYLTDSLGLNENHSAENR